MDLEKGNIKKKKKEDSSESELEEGELRQNKEIQIKSAEEQGTEEQANKDQVEPSKNEYLKEMSNEECSKGKDSDIATDDNKENTNEERVVSLKNPKDSIKDETSTNTEAKPTDSETEAKGNNASGGKNGEIKVVEQAKLVNDVIEIEESDDYLMYLEEILKKIHAFFYEIHDGKREGDRDMKKVIPSVRKEVLANTKLVFSGLVPTNQSLEQSKAYSIAKSLGAEVSQELTKDCTHLVAVRTGTAKVCL